MLNEGFGIFCITTRFPLSVWSRCVSDSCSNALETVDWKTPEPLRKLVRQHFTNSILITAQLQGNFLTTARIYTSVVSCHYIGTWFLVACILWNVNIWTHLHIFYCWSNWSKMVPDPVKTRKITSLWPHENCFTSSSGWFISFIKKYWNNWAVEK